MILCDSLVVRVIYLLCIEHPVIGQTAHGVGKCKNIFNRNEQVVDDLPPFSDFSLKLLIAGVEVDDDVPDNISKDHLVFTLQIQSI